MIPKSIQEQLNQLAHKYAQQLLSQVTGVLSQPQYQAEGELAESLKVSVTPSTDTQAPVILLTYADQGFFIGYKNPQWSTLPNIEKLTKWTQVKNISLGDIPGYTYGTAPNLSDEKKKERIAFAIAKNKLKTDSWKPKRWKNAANLGELLRDLNNDTIQAWVKEVETILAHSITTGQVLS